MTLRNSLVWYNSGAAISGVTGSPVVEYCSIQGGFPGTGNIAAPPLFADPLGGDYHIMPGSPAINAGTTATFFLPSTDIDGESRVIWNKLDMGCDEVADISAAPATAGNVGTRPRRAGGHPAGERFEPAAASGASGRTSA